MALDLVILACLQGLVMGFLICDYCLRIADRRERQELRDELISTQKGLADLHNKNAEAMRGLQDKVNAHAMALASGARLK